MVVSNKFQDQLSLLNEQLTQQLSDESLQWYLKQIRGLYVEHEDTVKPNQTGVVAAAAAAATVVSLNETPTAPTTKYVPIKAIKAVLDQPTAPLIGSMLMFTYDPKLKLKLPYYDTFPLIFLLNHYGDSCLGLNLHYLPPEQRAMLFDALVNTLLNTKGIDEKSQLNISYKILSMASRFKLFKPCVKKYILRHIRSRVMVVNPVDWDKVLMMPLARFMKTSQERVWQDSIRQVGWR